MIGAPDVNRLSLGQVGVTRLVRPTVPVFQQQQTDKSVAMSEPGVDKWEWGSDTQLFLRSEDDDIDSALMRLLNTNPRPVGAASIHTVAQV